MKDKEPGIKIIAQNKNARRLYEFVDTAEAGIMLMGSEVKSLRAGRVSFKDGYVQFVNNEAWLVGVHISPYANAVGTGHEPERRRKLLLHAREIHQFRTKVEQKGLAVIPVKIYFKNSKVKLEIALGRGKKTYDQRDDLKRRDIEREMAREFR
jgi:SsrA-binding protein